jgi:hypothetical protein
VHHSCHPCRAVPGISTCIYLLYQAYACRSLFTCLSTCFPTSAQLARVSWSFQLAIVVYLSSLSECQRCHTRHTVSKAVGLAIAGLCTGVCAVIASSHHDTHHVKLHLLLSRLQAPSSHTISSAAVERTRTTLSVLGRRTLSRSSQTVAPMRL